MKEQNKNKKNWIIFIRNYLKRKHKEEKINWKMMKNWCLKQMNRNIYISLWLIKKIYCKQGLIKFLRVKWFAKLSYFGRFFGILRWIWIEIFTEEIFRLESLIFMTLNLFKILNHLSYTSSITHDTAHLMQKKTLSFNLELIEF